MIIAIHLGETIGWIRVTCPRLNCGYSAIRIQ